MNFKDWYLFENSNFRQVLYHGTCLKFLPSILSQGLIPNINKTNWNQDRELSLTNNDLTSYGGVYLATQLRFAKFASTKSAKENKSEPIIVICSINQKTAISDEDYVLIPAIYDHNLYQNLVLYKYYLNKNNNDLKEFYLQSYNSWKSKLLKSNDVTSLNDNYLKRIDLVLKELFFTIIKRTIILSKNDNLNYDWSRLFDQNEKIPDLPSNIQEVELMYRKLHDQLSKIIKRFDWSMRVMSPIRYSGTNKILSIVQLLDENNVKIHYGTIPQQFIDDYKNFISGDIKFV
jgi:hypothetical protein